MWNNKKTIRIRGVLGGGGGRFLSQMRLDSGRLCGSVGELKKGISRAEKSRAERDAVRSGRA